MSDNKKIKVYFANEEIEEYYGKLFLNDGIITILPQRSAIATHIPILQIRKYETSD